MDPGHCGLAAAPNLIDMSIYTILDRLDFMRGEPAAFLVLIAAALAIAAWDMRLVLPALAVQYLGSFLLYVDVLDPRLAIVYTLTGVTVTLIMTVTAAQVNWGRPPANLTSAERDLLNIGSTVSIGPLRPSPQQLIRLVLAFTVPIGLFIAARSGVLSDGFGLPETDSPAYVQMVVMGLVSLGLIGIVTGNPLFSGVGLLIVLNGFDLFNSSTEQSIALVVALSAVNLLVALVVAYVAQAQFLPVEIPE